MRRKLRSPSLSTEKLLTLPTQKPFEKLPFPSLPVSGVSMDGFHPRQFAMLSQGGLTALALLFRAMERIGRLPDQLVYILFVRIPKPAGGVRPIALFSSLYRL